MISSKIAKVVRTRTTRFLVAGAVMALMIASLSGCGKSYTTFPEGTSIYGIDISQKTPEEAMAALSNAIDGYSLGVTLDEAEFALSSTELGVKLNDQIDWPTTLTSLGKGEMSVDELASSLITVGDNDSIKTVLTDAYSQAMAAIAAEAPAEEPEENVIGGTIGGTIEDNAATEGEEVIEGEEAAEEAVIERLDITKAYIVFDETSQTFIGMDGEDGEAIDFTKATDAVAEAAAVLAPEVATESEMVWTEGEKASESQAVAEALKTANDYLNINLVYQFTPATGDPSEEAVPVEEICKWLMVQNDGLTISLDDSLMASYCTTLAEAHSVAASNTAKFKTTGGSYIDVRVKTAGETVDENELFKDLYECISTFTSGTRQAAYSTVTEKEEFVDYDGNYVEIDLTNQMVYCYKNHECIVSSPCVSGNAWKGYATPTGNYTIFSMDKNRYLVGPGYRSYVNYFMPFNGGVGLHDASWRGSFGGSIYMYSGSHGCINMPYNAVKKIFNNVGIGTHVIVYGGVTSVSAKSPSFNGTGQYDVNLGSAFHLDTTFGDSDDKEAHLTYSSNNPAVATVDGAGNVTAVGPGSCVITVSSNATRRYVAGNRNIIINVTDPNAVKPEPQPEPKPEDNKPEQKPEDPKPGDNGNTGGDNGGSTGGDNGGSTGGDNGGDNGGSTGGDNGGDNGGSTGGDNGGDNGGSQTPDPVPGDDSSAPTE